MTAVATVELTAAYRRMVASAGSAHQWTLYSHGKMEVGEILSIARATLYEPLAGVPRYRRMSDGDLPHARDCAGGAPRFMSCAAEGKTPDQEVLMARLVEDVRVVAVQFGAEVDARLVEHFGACDLCTFGYAHRRTISVRCRWVGHLMTREYAT